MPMVLTLVFLFAFGHALLGPVIDLLARWHDNRRTPR